MSVILTIYSQRAYREFVLPAIHNAETELLIEQKTFGLSEDLELHLEQVDGVWSFLPSKDYAIEANSDTNKGLDLRDLANYKVTSVNGESLSAIVQMKETAFVSYTKYKLSPGTIEIGNAADAGIYYSYEYSGHQYISKQHATLRGTADGLVLEEHSTNGVFINDVRIQNSYRLSVGDHIHIWGLNMVYLGEILAVRPGEQVNVNTGLLTTFPMPDADVGSQPEVSKLYNRAPRNLEMLETEVIEIESPPEPRLPGDMPLIMAIGPAMTMAIPMVMSSIIAISGARSSGAHASTFMYTGIITSLSSALIGVIWAVNNIRYGKTKAQKEENHRFEAYSDYLIKCTDKIKEKYEHNMRVMLEMYPSAIECVSEEMEKQKRMWNRNSTHRDFLSHRLGIGDMPFQVSIQIPKERFTLVNDSLADKPGFINESYRTLHQVPICFDMKQERLVGIVGGEDKAGAYPVVYALAAQIAANNCYTDVKMAFVFQEEQGIRDSRWDFAWWLPHTWSADKKMRYVASNKNTASDVFYELTKVLRFRNEEKTAFSGKGTIYKPHYILFVEQPSFLEGELIAKYIFDKDQDLGLTVILLAEEYESLPNSCECIIQNDHHFSGKYHVRTGERTEISFDPINQEILEQMARRLANLEVNEIEVGGEIPSSITFFDMYGISRLEELGVEERWKKNRTYDNMKALVGQKAGGVPCYLDVHEKYHGPHGLVAGTTGSGKSETLQTYMLSLAVNFSPDDIGFFIIDYKGGGMANLFNGLPHILGQISNLSGNQVHRAMVSIKSENKRRQREFNEHGVNNINTYTALYKNGEAVSPVPHLFIIIDEFAELKREESDFMKELISVAQVGRSLGVHLILATQKPSGTVDDNIWSNSKFRLCLRVQDRQDSVDMLHKPDAAYLTQAGRSYLQVGNDELYELFQSGWSGADYTEDGEGNPQVLAVMLSDTGKAALAGGHAKRRMNEERKHKWVIRLCGYMKEAIAEWELEVNDGEGQRENREEVLKETLFDLFADDGIDYLDNDYNSRLFHNLILLYDEVMKEEPGDEMVTAAAIAAKAVKRNLKLPEMKGKTQLDAVVGYLAEAAVREGYKPVQQLWLPVLPQELELSQLEGYAFGLFDDGKWPQYPLQWELKAMIGLCDDPVNQAQMPLEINFTEHTHHAACGIAMSGKSTMLQTIIYDLIHRYPPSYLNLYILDFSSRMLGAFEHSAHVGGILYENDLETIGKFFRMVERMVKERKQMFRGGNYNQYVMTHGVTCPAVVVVIDNIANFRKLTDFVYDDVLIQLARECAAYGIYLLMSGAGFNSAEIPARLRESIHRTICLEMSDRYQYGEVLNTMQLSTVPESGIHGRGLVQVNDDALEFQAALAVLAADDYKRGEAISRECEQLNRCWQDKPARQIPKIPEKPVWKEFAALDEMQTAIADDRSLPIGYDMETADIYSVNLSESYCYLISGKRRIGKTNLLKVMMCSAAKKQGKLVVVEFGSQELHNMATGLEAEYVNSYEAFMEFMDRFIPVFQERNRIKKECQKQGLEEQEMFARMSREQTWYIYIADLVEFAKLLHSTQGARDNVCGGMANLLEKGFLHNIYFFACMNQDQCGDVISMDVYNKFVLSKAGIHLGGKVSAQRLFEFNGMPYAEQSAAEKAGVGAVPPTDNEPYHKLVIPLVKGHQEI